MNAKTYRQELTEKYGTAAFGSFLSKEESTLLHEKENYPVLVSYPDSTSRQTTVDELTEFFKEETTEWNERFFDRLLRLGVADSMYAQYTLIK